MTHNIGYNVNCIDVVLSSQRQWRSKNCNLQASSGGLFDGDAVFDLLISVLHVDPETCYSECVFFIAVCSCSPRIL